MTRPSKPTDMSVLARQLAQRAHPQAAQTRQPTPVTYLKATIVSLAATGATVAFLDSINGSPATTNVPNLPCSVPAFPGDVVLVAKQGGVRWVTEILGRDYTVHGLAAIGYGTGWADLGGGVPGGWYWDASKVVHLRGALAPPAGAGLQTVVTLPVAPAGTAGFTLATNAAPVTCTVLNTGAVQVSNPGGLTSVNLDQVAFPVGR